MYLVQTIRPQTLDRLQIPASNGKVFTSDRYRQEQTAEFKIERIIDFYDEVNEVALKQIDVTFNMTLFARDNSQIEVQSQATRIAVRLP